MGRTELILKNRLRLRNPPPELSAFLKETLRFQNPKWTENERLGRFNQKTPKYLKFYFETDEFETDEGGLAIPRGCVRMAMVWLKRAGVDYDLTDRRRRLAPVNFAFAGHLEPFQQQAVDAMASREFGVLQAPTGAGKTVMALALVARRAQPALVVVHTRELADQWAERISAFLGIDEAEVGRIGGGRMDLGRPITVALIQSLYKCADTVSATTGHLIVDECHRIPSRTFTEAAAAFDARHMLGLTATPYRRDGLERIIHWHLGDIHHRVEADGLVENGRLLEAEVIFRPTGFIPHFDPTTQYSKMLSELTRDDQRNRLIAADVAMEAEKTRGEGVILLLSDRRQHCENLKAILKLAHGLEAERLTGDLPAARRREVLAALGEGKIRVLLATGQLIGEGFDSRHLSTLFIATPIRFRGRLIQYLGRILRPAPGKERALVYDYVDEKVGPLAAAARARQRAYGLPDEDFGF